jgi:isoquinoline 1-oxidoreductase beta subunit
MTALAPDLSRRGLLKSAGALVVGAALPSPARAQAPGASAPAMPAAFVRVGADDVVTVLIKHIEFGQGPFTGLATLVAEEMDADWAQMRAEHAPADAKLYANLAFGLQGTGGSTAMANSFLQMRKAGAAARAMLVQAAAEAWKVPAAEITIEKGVLRHPSGQQGRFGQFAEAAARLPVPAEPALKPASSWRLIGKEGATPRLDGADKARGKAVYTIDLRAPGMLTVVVARPPRFGGKVARFDATKALQVRGVREVKQIGSGVAVYADGMWQALKGREALTIEWDESGAETRGSQELIAEYRALAQTPGALAGAKGETASAFSGADKTIEREFVFPYLAHAPMEPLDGYLEWDGTSALARFGSQFQTTEHMTIASILGLPLEKVRLETMLAGGSFGRRAQISQHLAAELAMAAKAIGPGRPIKLAWTREDDLTGGYYRPLALHRLRGALKDGKITAWENRIVGQSFMKGTMMEAFAVKNGVDATLVEGASALPYEIANFRCEAHSPTVGVPTLWWRSVGHSHTAYAVECFIDELLRESGQDPVAGRLGLIGERHARAAGVLRAVAEMAKWTGPNPAPGRGRGVAVVESFGSFVAQIAEVSLGAGGAPRVEKVWCAVDCGTVVNPDIVRAQMEGGIGFGLGHALYGEVTLDKGRPVQTNFDTYRSLRIDEAPAIEVRIIASQAPPTGVGEPGVPPIGPAVANALAALGRPRPTHLPIVGGA